MKDWKEQVASIPPIIPDHLPSKGQVQPSMRHLNLLELLWNLQDTTIQLAIMDSLPRCKHPESLEHCARIPELSSLVLSHPHADTVVRIIAQGVRS